MSEDTEEVAPPKNVPQGTAGWLLYWMERFEKTVREGLQEIRNDLTLKADKDDLLRAEGQIREIRAEVDDTRNRVIALEDDRKTGAAVRQSWGLTWHVAVSVASLASPVGLLIEILRPIHG